MKRLSLIFLVLVNLFFVQNALAQPHVDSLLNMIETAENDSARLFAYSRLTKELIQLDPDQCIEYAQKQLELAEEADYQKYVADAYVKMGAALFGRGDDVEANAKILKGLRLAEEIGSDEVQVGGNLMFGNLLVQMGQPEKAKEKYRRGLQLCRQGNGDKANIPTFYLTLALASGRLEQLDSAIYYDLLAIEMLDSMGDLPRLGAAYNNLATAYFNTGREDEGIIYLKKGIEINTQMHNNEWLAIGYANLAAIYAEEKNDPDSAIYYFEKTLELAGSHNIRRMQFQSYKSLGQLFHLKGMFEKASLMKDSALVLSQELFNEEVAEQIKEMQEQFETERLEKEKELLEKENELEKQQRIIQEQRASEAEAREEKANQTTMYALAGIALVAILAGFIFYSLQQKKKTNKVLAAQKREVEEKNTQLENAYLQIEIKNNEIVDSINYAKRLQDAILPDPGQFKQVFSDAFVLYLPKDIVAGDFYWFERSGDTVLFAAADCTGHGVPGAMVSVVCANALNRAVNEMGLTDPGAILDAAVDMVVRTFSSKNSQVNDGMDISLAAYNTNTGGLSWAGANNPLLIQSKGDSEIRELKGDKQPVGQFDGRTAFTTHSVPVSPGDSLYMFSDGFVDQFGGERGKKFKSANFKQLLASLHDQSMDQQMQAIHHRFEEWRGELEQLDDVCVIGVTV